jgi:ferredoxin-NADP reductase
MTAIRTSLDRLTGRVTMYRLMIIVLGAIALIAVILGIIPGGLAYSTLALLASLATMLVVTYLSNRLVAALFRVTPHAESSVITALLLFFLFRPSFALADLGIAALVAIIASVSKYVLAIRGRHIFNPVAIAAVIIALTQLSGATWWVATPYLLAPVVIGGFLVVYRLRRFAIVGTFLAVAFVLTVARFTSQGLDPVAAAWLALGSAPLVFFAVFMLDEPLTQPPLRWQQLVVAAVVGVIYSVSFSFGPVYTSPELALVVGNILAFFFGQKRAIRLEFIGSRELTPTARELSFLPASGLAYRAGQYVELTLPHSKADARGVRRIFSVTSPPTGSELSFGLRVPEESSSFKRAIGELQPGDRVAATSVGGDFVLPRDSSTPLLLVAGGIGITPFISHLRHLRSVADDRDIVLVYAVSDAAELAYADELEAMGVQVLVVAPSTPSRLAVGWDYLGSGHLTATMLADRVPRLTARHAYVSGPPAMVSILKRDLRALGLRRIRSDYFAGY